MNSLIDPILKNSMNKHVNKYDLYSSIPEGSGLARDNRFLHSKQSLHTSGSIRVDHKVRVLQQAHQVREGSSIDVLREELSEGSDELDAGGPENGRGRGRRRGEFRKDLTSAEIWDRDQIINSCGS